VPAAGLGRKILGPLKVSCPSQLWHFSGSTNLGLRAVTQPGSGVLY